MKITTARAFHISLIFEKLIQLGKYHGMVERFIAKEIKSLYTRWEKQSPKIAKELKHELENYYVDEKWLLAVVFTRTLRASVLIAAYTLFEVSLEAICLAEQKHHQEFVVKLSDLTGKGVERAKLYLSKICGVNFPGTSQEWNRLMQFKEIRHVLMHADGDVDQMHDSQKIKNIIRRTNGLELHRGAYINIKEEYVFSVIKDIREFFKLLHKGFQRTQWVRQVDRTN